MKIILKECSLSAWCDESIASQSQNMMNRIFLFILKYGCEKKYEVDSKKSAI